MADSDTARKRKARWKEIGGTLLQLLKWSAVIWCLWPLARFSEGSIQFTRVLLGILLFIIFSGKMLYDTIIMDYIRQRRTTLKQDIAQFLGMILAVALIVGLVLLMIAALIMESMKPTGNVQ
jgi:cobalamin biosynthesis protein CobD/CbiB